jgi:hypothetical protein
MLRAGDVFDNQGKKIKHFTGGGDHFVNFIQALRSGRREDLHAEILEGHLSTSICHAGNISHRLGQRATAADMRKQIGELPPMQEMFDQYLAHLKAHDVEPDESTLGPWLHCDREHERFLDSEKANALVKGTYREPYVVSEVKIEAS